MKTRVTTVLGTRPEMIRLSSIISRLDEVFDHRLLNTSQNYDPLLSKIFFDEMKIRKPDSVFEIKSDTLGTFLGHLFIEIEKEFDEFPPEALVILGDTNSSLAGIIAKRRGIPVYHLEAGNRSFDDNVPEEINRKIVDHFSDFNLAYTTHAKENLIREGLSPRNIIIIGSPLCEVLSNYKNQIENSNILNSLKIKAHEYFLVSAHRQENIDDPLRMLQLIDGLNGVAEKYNVPIIVSTHPRMRSKIDNQSIEIHRAIQFHKPFGFFDYNKMQKEARIVLSDSGSVSEESAILGFPAITIRDSIERPEALEAGSIIMSGITRKGMLEAITILENTPSSQNVPQEYLIPDSSNRVVRFIASTVHQHSFWSGLRSK
jgi:UDP-N-acetylglucosamine 2-epimerase (non-hydrolysing)